MDLATSVSDTDGIAVDYVNHGHDDGKIISVTTFISPRIAA